MAIDPQRALPRSGEQMTVEEYFRLDDMRSDLKFEYQDGRVRLMSGSSREHDLIAFNMPTALK